MALLGLGLLAGPIIGLAADSNLISSNRWIASGPASAIHDTILRLSQNDLPCSSSSNCSTASALFRQEANVKGNDGKYALLISYTRAEKLRTNTISGLPYVYGYFLDKNGKILTYLQGQSMRHTGTTDNTWVVSYGIFKIPSGTENTRFFLKQASRKGTTSDGRAADFYKPGLYLFSSEQDAKTMVESYRNNLSSVPK